MVLAGDVNNNLLLINYRNVELYLNTVFSQGIVPKAYRPARVTSHSTTLIDHILVNNYPSVSNSGIYLSDISDHFTAFVTLKCTETNRNRRIELEYRERSEAIKFIFLAK